MHAEFEISTDERVTTVDVTERVEDQVPNDADGTATVFVKHTTAGISVNEAEPRLLSDISASCSLVQPWRSTTNWTETRTHTSDPCCSGGT